EATDHCEQARDQHDAEQDQVEDCDWHRLVWSALTLEGSQRIGVLAAALTEGQMAFPARPEPRNPVLLCPCCFCDGCIAVGAQIVTTGLALLPAESRRCGIFLWLRGLLAALGAAGGDFGDQRGEPAHGVER